MISVNFVGKLGKDAKILQTQSQTNVLVFPVAVSTDYRDKEAVSWLNCSVFGARADKLAMHLMTGTGVFISGELSEKKYTNKNGESKTSLNVKVDGLEFVGKAKQKEPRYDQYRQIPENKPEPFQPANTNYQQSFESTMKAF